MMHVTVWTRQLWLEVVTGSQNNAVQVPASSASVPITKSSFAAFWLWIKPVAQKFSFRIFYWMPHYLLLVICSFFKKKQKLNYFRCFYFVKKNNISGISFVLLLLYFRPFKRNAVANRQRITGNKKKAIGGMTYNTTEVLGCTKGWCCNC